MTGDIEIVAMQDTLMPGGTEIRLVPLLNGAALLLKGRHEPMDWLTRVMDGIFGGFFSRFNRFFRWGSQFHGHSVSSAIGRKGLVLIAYAVLLSLAALMSLGDRDG